MQKTTWEELPVEERGLPNGWQGMSPEARLAAWEAYHGGGWRGLLIGTWVLFPDGAQRERDPNGTLIHPPADEEERLRLVLQYCEEHQRRARDAFIELKERLTQQVDAGVRQQQGIAIPPNETELERLHDLRRLAATWAAEVAEARGRLLAAKPDWKVKQEALAAEYKQKNEAFLDRLNAIRL